MSFFSKKEISHCRSRNSHRDQPSRTRMAQRASCLIVLFAIATLATARILNFGEITMRSVLHLPCVSSDSIVNFDLQAEGGCFEWNNTKPTVATIEVNMYLVKTIFKSS
jgi:hypothetical protein